MKENTFVSICIIGSKSDRHYVVGTKVSFVSQICINASRYTNVSTRSMSLMENSNTQVVLDDQLQHFIETETKKQQFQVSS